MAERGLLALALRQTLRRLRRERGFLWAALLGIGFSSALAALTLAYAWTLWGRPLPYAQAQQLQSLRLTSVLQPSSVADTQQASLRAALQFALGHAGVAVAVRQSRRLAAQAEVQAPLRQVDRVSANYARVLGLRLAAGTWPAPDQGAAVLALPLARRWFGSARAALGQRVYLDGTPLRVAGVLRADYLAPVPLLQQRGTQATALVLPVDFTAQLAAYQHSRDAQMGPMSLVARGTSARWNDAMQDFLDADAASSTQQYLLDARITPLPRLMLEQERAPLRALLAMALVLFASALLGFAVFALARYAARVPDWALQRLLGAHAWRAATQDASELALILLVAGLGALALLAAVGAAALANPVLSRIVDIALLLRAALLLPALLGMTGMLLWGLRSLQYRHAAAGGVALNRRAGASTRTEAMVLRGVLGMQLLVALATGVLVSASLAQGAATVRAALGQDWRDVLAVRLQIDPQASDGSIDAGTARLRDALERWPGMRAAARSNGSPLNLQGLTQGFVLRFSGREALYSLAMMAVDPAYFRLFHYRLLWGRMFDAGASNVALFTPAAQRAVVGSTARAALADALAPPQRYSPLWNDRTRVIGAIAATRVRGVAEDNPFATDAIIFVPFRASATDRSNQRVAWLLARGDSLPDAAQLDTMVRQSGLPVTSWRRVDLAREARARVLAQLGAALSGLLLGCVVLLAVAQSAYAAMRYALLRRGYDYGVRVALGAEPAALRRAYARRELLPVLLVLGLAAILSAWWLRQGVRLPLTGIVLHAHDALGAALLVMLLVILAFVHALRRFARHSPLGFLRAE